MATALFITRKQLVQNTIMDGNIDTDKFIQYIKIAQEIHIKNYLGTDLYTKISNDIAGVGGASLSGNYLTLVTTYLQPMLIHYAMSDYLIFAPYKLQNGGLYKHTSENSDSVTQDEVEKLSKKELDMAEYYTRRFIDYMSFNQSLFPEYTSNTNDDIDPDKDSLFNNWVL